MRRSNVFANSFVGLLRFSGVAAVSSVDETFRLMMLDKVLEAIVCSTRTRREASEFLPVSVSNGRPANPPPVFVSSSVKQGSIGPRPFSLFLSSDPASLLPSSRVSRRKAMDSPVCRTAIDAAHSKSSAAQHYAVGKRSGRHFHNTPKTTTPLLQWSYATRMHCLWKRLYTTLLSMEEEDQKVQLLIVGTGLDCLGFDLVHAFACRITHLMEVDLPPVCALKRSQLIQRQKEGDDASFPLFFTDDELENNKDDHLVVRGRYHQTNYSLVALDLNDDEATVHSVLDRYLSTTSTSSRLLVVSELVVSYLRPTACDALLAYFGKLRSDCSILLYEVLGPIADDGETEENSSVTENYRKFYCQQFQAKLQRGTHTNNNESSLLHPLGKDLETVEQRLQQAGFDTVYACHPEPCTVTTNNTPVLFDEHAAMALHIQTYVVVCGFHATASRWHRQSLQGDDIRTIVHDKTTYCIVPALAEDTESLRQAFQETYATETTSVSIQKMVQQVLKSDFAPLHSIGQYYREHEGGNYWAAIDKNDPTAVVVGGVGMVRRRHVRSVVYEIQRVFVKTTHRQRGIAQALIHTAMHAMIKKHASCSFVAVTLTRLREANQLYVKMGFQEVEPRQQKGDLTYVVYTKDVSSSTD